jgi:ATP-dependent Clp protease ATP-binding subunit ClpA
MTRQVLADRVFTVECRRIFARAETLATELEHPAVGTEHLLLAMLDIPSFGAARLAEAGVDAERVRVEVTTRTHTVSDDEALGLIGIDVADVLDRVGGIDVMGTAELPWTDLALQVLIDASDLAVADGEAHQLPSQLRITGTDWLFLALLEREEGIAAEVITALGVRRTDVLRQVLDWVPVMNRFRQRMLDDSIHGRYLAVLAAWNVASPAQQAATSSIVEALHHAHDQLISAAVTDLGRPAPDEARVASDYFSALARPVEEAALALAQRGISLA